MKNFWENKIPIGYYDLIVRKGLENNRGIQACWHNLTYIKTSQIIYGSKEHLDYACGPGTLIGNYTKSNSLGVDISANQINYAKNNYLDKGQFKTLDDFNLKKNINKFDAITVIGLFEYLKDSEIIDLLNELYRILNDKGKLIITTPNYGGSMYLIDKLLNFFGPVDYGLENINKFSKKRIYKLIDGLNKWDINISMFNNIFLFFALFNLKFAVRINNFFEKLTKNKMGFLLLIELSKK